MSVNGRPLLCDFGISRLLVDGVTITGTRRLKGSVRWMATELFEPGSTAIEGRPNFDTKASDVWAYGMVLYVRQWYPLHYNVHLLPSLNRNYYLAKYRTTICATMHQSFMLSKVSKIGIR